MTKPSYLDVAVKRIKAAKSDDHIKFIIAAAVGRSSMSLPMVEEADEVCINFDINTKKAMKKRK
jgi:hypothetical protein